jgi:hypothetical protein
MNYKPKPSPLNPEGGTFESNFKIYQSSDPLLGTKFNILKLPLRGSGEYFPMKKIYQISIILLCIYVQTADAQMGVNSSGAAPASSSILDVSSTTKGLLIPRMTSAQRNAIALPANGLMVYTTDIGEIQVYDGGWKVASRLNVPLLMSGSIATGVVQGFNTGSGAGSYGYAGGGGEGGKFVATTGTGATGTSTSGYGLLGTSSSNTGVVGTSSSGSGVVGIASTSGYGTLGQSVSGIGVYGSSTSGTGAYGISTSGIGVSGISTSNTALYGFSGTSHGLYAEINGGTVAAARIVNNNGTGNAIYANNNSGTNAAGRFVNNNANGDASRFEATNGMGVNSFTTGTGNAVQGDANSGFGGYFRSVSGIGLAAISTSGNGFYAENSSSTVPVAQIANVSGGTGIEVIASTALKITGAIKVAGGISSQPAFKIVSSAGNTAGHVLTIPNTTLANNANDILIVTHNYSPTSVYLTKPYGVYWTGASWAIFIEDFTAMAVGTAFNVLVIKQ